MRPFSTAPSPTYGVDFLTGEILPVPSNATAFDIAFGNLFALVSKYPWFDNATRPSPIPDELLLPFSVIVDRYGLQPLVQTLFPDTVTAIADYNDVLALYALIDLKPALLYLLTTPGSGFYIDGGCIHMYDGIVDYIGRENVLTSVKYLDVERPPNGWSNAMTRITVLVGEGPGSYVQDIHCGAVVVAFPEDQETIAFLEPDDAENDALEGFTFRYWAAVEADVEGPIADSGTGFTLYNWDPTKQYQVPAPPCVQSISRVLPYGPAGSYITSKTYLTHAEAYAVWRSQMANLPGSLVTNSTIVTIVPHASYQPNAPASVLARPVNVYELQRQLEGYRNTYWTSTTWGDNDSMLLANIGNVLAARIRGDGHCNGMHE